MLVASTGCRGVRSGTPELASDAAPGRRRSTCGVVSAVVVAKHHVDPEVGCPGGLAREAAAAAEVDAVAAGGAVGERVQRDRRRRVGAARKPPHSRLAARMNIAVWRSPRP